MGKPKEPPDKIKTLKVLLSHILNYDDMLYDRLSNALDRMNKLIIHVYQFLELWILNKYHNNKTIPEINEDLLKMMFKALSTGSTKGPKPTGIKNVYYNEFCEFYDNTYKGLGYQDKISSINLSHMIESSIKTMLTAIENNIKNNFMKYIQRFIHNTYKEPNDKILEGLIGNEKKLMRKQLKKDLNMIKNDMINNTLECDQKYHKWIKLHRPKILPKNTDKILYTNIHENPQEFISSMIYINCELEKLGTKLYQVLPLRKSLIPHHIPINTAILIELFIDKNKNEYFSKITELKDSIWKMFFNMDSNIFKMKNHKFNYSMTTDCYTVSIQFLNDKYEEQVKIKKELMSNGVKKHKTITKDMNIKEKEEYNVNKKTANKLKQKQIRDKKKEEYNKLSKAEKKILLDNRKKKKNEEGILQDEFPYLEDLTERQIQHLIFNCVYCDPGKGNLLTFIDDDDNVYMYTIRQRQHETKSKKYNKLLKNYRDKVKITEIENKLSDYNSKSCNIETFKKYVKIKNEINVQLYSKYNDQIFRRYKWYIHLNTKRSDSKLLDTIENKFAKKGYKLNIVMGDWSIGKQLRNFIPTPNLKLKRLLKERFNVYNLYEYNTSKLHYKTKEKCSNLTVTDKNGVTQKLHSVRTFSMVNRRGCVNRDINAVKNMRNLVEHYILYKERPKEFTNTTATIPSSEDGVKCRGARGTIITRKTISKITNIGNNTDDSHLSKPLKSIIQKKQSGKAKNSTIVNNIAIK